MKIKETMLESGATIIGMPVEGAKTLTIAFGFRVGSRLENLKIDGASHFVEHMLFKGSEKRPTHAAIAEAADRMGAYLNGGTSKEYTYYYIQTIKENFENALDIVGDFVTKPKFEKKDFEMERGTIIEELKRVKDNPESDILRLMEATLFKGSSMESEVLGTEESLSSMSFEDVKDHYQKYYSSSNLTVFIAGDIPLDYLDKVRVYVENLPIGEKSSWQPAFYASKKHMISKRDNEQGQLALIMPGYALSDHRRYTTGLIATILGGTSSSRLFAEIREKRGWAYTIGAYDDSNSDNGFLAVLGGLKSDKVEETINIVKEELFNFSKTVRDEEIERAIGYIKGITMIRYENTNRLAMHLLINKIIGGNIETPEEEVAKIEKITKKEIIAVAEDLFQKDKLYLSLIGPFSDEQKFAKILQQ